MFIVIFYFLEFIFCELAKFHHIKKTPSSKALGAEFSTCPKKVTWWGFKCEMGLISIPKSWRVVGVYSPYFPPQHVWQSYKEERIYNSPIQFSFTRETWKLGVFPVMVSIINIASAKGKMTEIPLHNEWECITMMHFTIAQPSACCIPCAGVSWSEMNTFKLPPLNAFLRPLIDFIPFSLLFF